MTPVVSLDVLSVMPSIRNAMVEIDAHAGTRRVTIIRNPGTENDSLRHWLDLALGGTSGGKLVRAQIGSGSNVAMMVATAAQISTMTPESQAADPCGGRRVHVLLSPLDSGATSVIEDYVIAFTRSLNVEHAEGIRLYVIDTTLRHSLGASALVAVTELTDLLPREEMDAYVMLRMTGRTGPYDTRLAQAIVQHFAGSDPRTAEALMGLSDERLIGLPAGVDLSDFPPMPCAIRQQLMGDNDALVLMGEYHAHEPARSEAAATVLRAKFRSACVQALMPWLEERRVRMVEVFKPALRHYEKRIGGLARPTKRSSMPVSMEAVEFNDIVSWEEHGQFGLADDWPQLAKAYSACKAARTIRNEIAHSGGVRQDRLLTNIAQVHRAFP